MYNGHTLLIMESSYCVSVWWFSRSVRCTASPVKSLLPTMITTAHRRLGSS